jgi:pimeloyl-ACP methyl ester carboxylesterase
MATAQISKDPSGQLRVSFAYDPLLITNTKTKRNPYVDLWINTWRIVSGSGFPLDKNWLRQVETRAYDRSFYPAGLGRNMLASLASGHRRSAFASIVAPTLVIHGDDDPLVPVENGRDSAETIPGAELMIIKGMGHSPPHRGPWPQIVEALYAEFFFL